MKRAKTAPQGPVEDVRIQEFLDMIAPSIVKFNTDHFICGNTFRCVWALREYPTATDEQAILSHLGDTVYVFEAPIDMLSFISLYQKDWQRHSYVALCGVAEHALLQLLADYPQINKIGLCLDHDEAGIKADKRIAGILAERGYQNVFPLFSVHKDWNEDIKAAHGLEAILAEEPSPVPQQAVQAMA